MKNLFNFLICLCFYLGCFSMAYAQSKLCNITLNKTTANFNKYEARNIALELRCSFRSSGSQNSNMVVPYCANEDICNKLMQNSCVTYELLLDDVGVWYNPSYDRLEIKAGEKNITLEIADYNNENKKMRAVYVESDELCKELIPPPVSVQVTN